MIHIDGQEVTINDVTIVDPTLSELMDDTHMEDRPELLARALEIGARVLVREQSGADIDWIRGEFDRIQAETMERIGSLLAADEGSNPLADFKAGALEALRNMAGQLTQALQQMSSRVGELEVSLEGLRTERESAAALEEERERGTAKGRPFEENVAAALDGFAGVHGDTCEHVGDFSFSGGRAGDVVINIGAAAGPSQGTIVFEAKTGKLSRPEAMSQLDDAMGARAADFAVLVVSGSTKTPARLRPLREYGGDKMVCVIPDDGFNRLAVVWEHLQLETAYTLARARVLMRKAAGESLDASAIAEAVERCLQALEDIRRVKQSLTGAQTSIETAKSLVDSIVTQARAQLAALADLVSTPGEKE